MPRRNRKTRKRQPHYTPAPEPVQRVNYEQHVLNGIRTGVFKRQHTTQLFRTGQE